MTSVPFLFVFVFVISCHTKNIFLFLVKDFIISCGQSTLCIPLHWCSDLFSFFILISVTLNQFKMNSECYVKISDNHKFPSLKILPDPSILGTALTFK